ncbi:hypothetical protein P6Z44_13460, partial [Enterococcus faecium]|uniref:hypothetical protein n=1 Tax=Enterococcus faecium TaxID=1352 RepID=UPI0028927ACE
IAAVLSDVNKYNISKVNDRIDQTNQKIAAVLSDVNEFRTDIDTLKTKKADNEYVKTVEDMVANMPTATPAETFASEAALRS